MVATQTYVLKGRSPGSNQSRNSIVFFLMFCCTGLYISKITGNIFVESTQYSDKEKRRVSAAISTPRGGDSCEDRFRFLFPFANDDESFEQDSSINLLFLHRNGESAPCGEITIGAFTKRLREIYDTEGCPDRLDKYHFESLLTKSLDGVLSNACHSIEEDGDQSTGLLGYCDMGEDHTPILLDHNSLVRVKSGQSSSLPCHFHTREGLRITQPELISELIAILSDENNDGNKENYCKGDENMQTCVNSTTRNGVHLYSVPAGRVFMFVPSFVGEIFHLPHVPGASDKPIYLEVMSLTPRVFDVFNFFSRDESKELVDRALAETSDTHRIKRSTTGASEKSVNSKRTSESGFDTSGKTAIKIKKRCFNALGFDEYLESHSDGLQILRYNVSKAYNSHLDWIEDRGGQLQHDYESSGTGGNRFATILLYMTDLDENEGGETVFPHGIPSNIPEEERITKHEAREQLRNSEQGAILKKGSWEEDLLATCRSKLAVRPHSSRAVLFYSQHPNGDVDRSSLHGACPVLSNQKFAANLWVWNTPRTGFSGAPIKKKFQAENGGAVFSKPTNMKISATFRNKRNDPLFDQAELFYDDTFWGKLGKGDPILSVNTFEGHVWNVKVSGKIMKTWVIKERNGAQQNLVI
mmetsp:Transcript_17929/g.41347  ORF Transcript_17929/g.41347 Transcript_17929/m.41347 type:complete len:640 (-) Transcript_17929:74-1993(-)